MALGTTTTAADTKETLVSKRSSTSVVWNYFGFKKEDAAQRQVWCKTCLATVATSQGRTTNLFQNLKKHHKALYDNCMAKMAISSVSHHQHSPRQHRCRFCGYFGAVDLAIKMDKFVTKIPRISTDPTVSSSENSTLSKTEESSSANVRQKKGRTFQASWKGKYPWIDY